jgi:hypothetical protein
MLDHLRQRVVETLASADMVTLSTFGPAQIQASNLPCAAVGICLYLLLPLSSDHLVNLAANSEVVVTAVSWQLQGTAVLLEKMAAPPELSLTQNPLARWSQLVQVRPVRLHIGQADSWGYSETIDI